MYRVNVVPSISYRDSSKDFCRHRQAYSKICVERFRWNSPDTEEQSEKTHFTSSQSYYVAPIIKTAWDWQRDRHTDQLNWAGNPNIDPHRYAEFVFDKDAKRTLWQKDIFFNKWCGVPSTPICKNYKSWPKAYTSHKN